MASARVGVDIGGTFTDMVICVGERVTVVKVPSTPRDPAAAVLGALPAALADQGAALAELRHGTTVATNAILEGSCPPAAFLVTEGFEDLLELRRQARPDLYALRQPQPPPLVPRDLCFGVPERIAANGAVLLPLDERAAADLARRVSASGVRSAAVCLLHAYLRPDAEALLGRALREAGVDASLSHEVLPAPGEYERACATVFNALVGPVVARYFSRMERELAPRSFWIMSSRGTAMAVEEAARRGVDTALSGPAAGVAGAALVAARHGLGRILTFDMGGTSTDVALGEGGRPALTREATIGDRPLGVEAVDITTIGAGGGSLARVDEAGVLRVGPQSAGAEPGPACYGRGGGATVTDANVVLGRLRPDWFLGGRMPLDAGAARRALEPVARALGGSVEAAALGVLRVAHAAMERALRRISLERGHDPRRFTLVAFGGAGPLHVCALARALGVPQVLVPPDPGALCALGALASDEVLVQRRTVMVAAGPGGAAVPEERLAATFGELEADLPPGARPALRSAERAERSLELRYRGQSHGLELLWEPGEASLGARFRSEHARRYGFDHGDAPVEVVAALLRRVRPGAPLPTPVAPALAPPRPWLSGLVFFEEGPRETPVFRRSELGAGCAVPGPCVVGEPTATLLVEADFAARVLPDGSLLLERRGGSA